MTLTFTFGFITLFFAVILVGNLSLKKYLLQRVSEGKSVIEIKNPLMKFSARWIDTTTGWEDSKLVETSSGKLFLFVGGEIR